MGTSPIRSASRASRIASRIQYSSSGSGPPAEPAPNPFSSRSFAVDTPVAPLSPDQMFFVNRLWMVL